MSQSDLNDGSQHSVAGITHFKLKQNSQSKQRDLLAVEEPLEIILHHGDQTPFTLAITMRTPGHDKELAAGFLFAEGVIRQACDIKSIQHDEESANPSNTLRVTLAQQINLKPERLQRYFFTNSSCGVCGKTSIQALELLHQPQLSLHSPVAAENTLYQLPEKLRKQQAQFSNNGSVHSAALFSPSGDLLHLREDVGRHNAMDKLIGSFLLNQNLSQAKHNLVLVSGRASFELIQKALMADIAFLASIGAPTSLALQLASRHNMTLAGFLKNNSFNIYTGQHRVSID